MLSQPLYPVINQQFMTPLKLALEYMDVIYGDRPIDLLEELLATQCLFKGPLYTFSTAADYIASLKSSPPKNFDYQIVEVFENASSVCLVYNFSKPGVSTLMSQLFRVSEGKITEILLVFDTAAFN